MEGRSSWAASLSGSWSTPLDPLLAAAYAQPVQATLALILVFLSALFWLRKRPLGGDGGAKNSLEFGSNHSCGQNTAATAYFRSLGAPDEPHDQGVLVNCYKREFVVGNTTEGNAFENDLCWGKALNWHRPTWNKVLDTSGTSRCGKYFCGKSRLWEVRLQFKFKKPPQAKDLFFGIYLEKYVPMSWATKQMMSRIVSMFRSVVGNQLYHSPGDNPKKSSNGELEHPVFSMPLWAFDQYIVTPEGEEPPDIADSAIETMGSKRSKRVKQYKQELDELELKAGPTYTFCFWGISRWLDRLNWQVVMPGMSVDFNKFCGAPPVYVCMYVLKTLPGHETEKRHLESRKDYFFNMAFWSSMKPPPVEEVQALLAGTEEDDLRDIRALHPGTDFAKRTPAGHGWLGCCINR